MTSFSESVRRFFRGHYDAVTVFVVTFLVFIPSINHSMLTCWDDFAYINAETMAFTWKNISAYFRSGMLGLYTPLTMISMMLDAQVYGIEAAWGFRLTNILFQSCNGVLLVLILRHLGVRRILCLLAALLWSVHPGRVESVVWLAERKDVLCGFFVLSSVYVFMKEYDRGRWPVLSSILLALAFFAKPTAAGVCSAMIVYGAWKNGFSKKSVLYALPSCLISALMMSYVFRVAGFNPAAVTTMAPTGGGGRFFPVVIHNAFFYFSNTILPLEMGPFYSRVDFHDYWIIPAFFGFFAVTALIWLRARAPWKPYLLMLAAFGFVWCACFPVVSGGFVAHYTDYADRYSYLISLPLIALTAYFAESVSRLRLDWSRYFQLGMIISAALCILQTLMYAPVWKNNQTLFYFAVAQSHNELAVNEKGLLCAASAAYRAKDIPHLEAYVDLLLRKADYVDPGDIPHISSLCRYNTGLFFGFFLAGLKNDPVTARATLGVLMEQMKSKDGMNIYDLEALWYDFRVSALNLLLSRQETRKAVEFLRSSARQHEAGSEFSGHDLFFLGMAEYLSGNYAKAVDYWKKAQSKLPDDAAVAANLAQAEQQMRSAASVPPVQSK